MDHPEKELRARRIPSVNVSMRGIPVEGGRGAAVRPALGNAEPDSPRANCVITQPLARKRRGANDPQALRRRVLDAAAEAFQARGYHATSTHDVMRAAGVTGARCIITSRPRRRSGSRSFGSASRKQSKRPGSSLSDRPARRRPA
jgi:hypothetical protein